MELKDLIQKYQRPNPEAKSPEFFFGSPYDDKCPECGASVVSRCRCMIGSCVCENGHEWYRDKDTGRAHPGNGHGK